MNAPYMTSCWSVKPEWRGLIPAVVHVDGTARPQCIKRDDNPFYYDIIEEFRRITGIPVLINTSFNGHESPIVCFTNEAAFMKNIGMIDVLVEGEREEYFGVR
jgi:carbamoyltransferase